MGACPICRAGWMIHIRRRGGSRVRVGRSRWRCRGKRIERRELRFGRICVILSGDAKNAECVEYGVFHDRGVNQVIISRRDIYEMV